VSILLPNHRCGGHDCAAQHADYLDHIGVGAIDDDPKCAPAIS
jgi:hypothetical protein